MNIPNAELEAAEQVEGNPSPQNHSAESDSPPQWDNFTWDNFVWDTPEPTDTAETPDRQT
jgi:hypothetical protein